MNTLILRTVARPIAWAMLAVSLVVLARGHNAPGGGFIGGLIAAAALALLGLARGAAWVRGTIRLHPMTVAALGLLVAIASGVPSLVLGAPFMTVLHTEVAGVPLSTATLFDLGVYLVVAGAMTSVALGLEQRDRSD